MSTAFVTDLEGFAMSRFNFSGAEPFVAPRVLPIVRGPTLRRSGVPIVAGFMPVGLLVPDNYTIPYYNDRTKQGYAASAPRSSCQRACGRSAQGSRGPTDRDPPEPAEPGREAVAE